ncbi:STAS domain-containing protein [Flocculibacter collagenilyticus]|uniref:STAS domain-containing protein n=1 Tax=Flocculibacter collagenilyticus TaxID=2744479 RepID=UPI0018F67D47|nr:STAS domain-containing protein [Flocculibacter collagenilyticus]
MYVLPNQMIINDIESIHTSLTEWLNQNEQVEFDAKQVQQCDTANLQLLCVIQNDLVKSGKSIQWHGQSDALITAAKMLGVAEFLKL